MYSSKDLLSEFESLDTAEWMQRINKYLKGRPFDELVLQLEGGASVKPFYRKEDDNIVKLPLLNSNDWQIAESFEFGGNDEKAVNGLILNALGNGSEAVSLKIGGGSPKSLPALLEGVYLEMIDLNLSGTAFEAAPADWLNALTQIPSGNKAKGYLYLSDFNESIRLYQQFSAKLPNCSFFNFRLRVDKQIIPSLSALLKDLKIAFDSLLSAGSGPETAQHQINIHVELSDDYFLNIAALRALKRCWLGIIEAFDVENPVYPKIHTLTSQSPASEDPYWNMISNTAQALSAAISQVSSIEVRPTDRSEEKAVFSRRIARNVQHLLKMESHIDHIGDPSAGSYFIENYTAQITDHAWSDFVSKL